ncbi:MAG: response regulator transcription factor [Acidimicrobiia bacterium]
MVLADDHQMLRQAVRRALEEAGLSVVGEAADGNEAVNLVQTLTPDVVLMDVSMPVIDGIEATRRITANGSSSRILVLTMHDEDALRARAIRAGAVGFLTKDCELREVVESVRAVASGEMLISRDIAQAMLAQFPEVPVADEVVDITGPLTRREKEVLQSVADGRSTTEIGRELFISVKTVKNHLASIYAKLDARDRTQAVISGVRMGIVHLR